MNNFFFCILLIASCRTQSPPNDANGATQAVESPVVYRAPLNQTTVVNAAPVNSEGPALADSGDAVQEESNCDINDEKSFFDELTITKKSGSGTKNEPFVLECTKDEKHTSFEIYCDKSLRIMQKKDSDNDFVVTKDQLERKCDLPNNIAYLRETLIPFRNLDETSITGTGQLKDPFVVKCVENYTLPNLYHYNTIQLVNDEGNWSLLDFTFDKTNSERSSTVEIGPKKDDVQADKFTCKDGNNALQKCDLTSFTNSKLTTNGMQQIPNTADTKFHVSCVENNEEFTVYCKSTNTIVEKNTDGEESPIDAKEIEKRCDVFTNIEYLKENLIPFRGLNGTSITGTGQTSDPFVVKCETNLTLTNKNFYNKMYLIWDNSGAGTWKIKFEFSKLDSLSLYSEITIENLTQAKSTDPLTCEDNSCQAIGKNFNLVFDAKLETDEVRLGPHEVDYDFLLKCSENDLIDFSVLVDTDCSLKGFSEEESDFSVLLDKVEVIRTCDIFTNIKSLKENLIPNRNLDPEDITGTGVTNDPFVVKCITGHYLNNKNNFDRLLLIHNEDNWQLLNFTVDKSNELRKLKITIDKTDSYNESDSLSCKSSATKPIQKCELFVDPKIQTFGMKQIPYQPNTNFYLSCAQNDAEFAVYCKNDTKIYDKITDIEITALEINKRCFDVQYLIDTLTQTDRNLQDELTGSGKTDDPFIVKCKPGFSIYNKKHVDTIVFFTGKIKTWKISNYYSNPKTEKRYSEMNNVELRNALNCTSDDPLTPLCDITSFKNNQKLNTYGITTLKNKDNNNVFYVSCAKNSQEFGISCKDNRKLMDTRYGLTETEISSEVIEKRCNICPLKDLWQKIIPMNMILSPREAEKNLLQCTVNYAKIADKTDLEAKCSDEGEWEVYQLDTGIKVEFDNIYCEREGCNGYELSGKSSSDKSIGMKYTMAVDLVGDGIERPIEFIHLE